MRQRLKTISRKIRRVGKRIHRLKQEFVIIVTTLVVLLMFVEIQIAVLEAYIGKQDTNSKVISNEVDNQVNVCDKRLNLTLHDIPKVQTPNPIEQKADESENRTISKEDIVLERDMDINKTTGISKEEFRKIIEHMKYDYTGFFKRNADIIYDTCQEHDINELFFMGVIALESGWGSSERAIANNNYTSQMVQGKLRYFSSEAECIITTASSLRTNYLNEDGKYYNGTTINAVNEMYCSPIVVSEKGERAITLKYEWANRVYSCMERILFY